MSGFNLKRHVVLFVCAVAALSLMSSCPCPANSAETNMGFPLRKWTVHVVNGLSPRRTLSAHCKSKDDDLGVRSLVPGTVFNWTFKMNFQGTTLYWCNVGTDHEHSSFRVFWPEGKHIWLQYRCNWRNCIWIAKDDGVYITNIPENRDEFLHKWEQGLGDGKS